MKTGIVAIDDLKAELGSSFRVRSDPSDKKKVKIYEVLNSSGTNIEEATTEYEEIRRTVIEDQTSALEDFNKPIEKLIDRVQSLIHMTDKTRPGSLLSKIYRSILTERFRYIRIVDVESVTRVDSFKRAILGFYHSGNTCTTSTRFASQFKRLTDKEVRTIFDNYATTYMQTTNPERYPRTPLIVRVPEGYTYIPSVGRSVVSLYSEGLQKTRIIVDVKVRFLEAKLFALVKIDSTNKSEELRFELPVFESLESIPPVMYGLIFKDDDGTTHAHQPERFYPQEPAEEIPASTEIVPQAEPDQVEILPGWSPAVLISNALRSGEKLSAMKRILLVMKQSGETTVEKLIAESEDQMLCVYKPTTIRSAVYGMLNRKIVSIEKSDNAWKLKTDSKIKLTRKGIMMAIEVAESLIKSSNNSK